MIATTPGIVLTQWARIGGVNCREVTTPISSCHGGCLSRAGVDPGRSIGARVCQVSKPA